MYKVTPVFEPKGSHIKTCKSRNDVHNSSKSARYAVIWLVFWSSTVVVITNVEVVIMSKTKFSSDGIGHW